MTKGSLIQEDSPAIVQSLRRANTAPDVATSGQLKVLEWTFNALAKDAPDAKGQVRDADNG